MMEKRKARVVLVDDETEFLALMRLQLGEDYEVTCFSGGQALLDGIVAHPPDVLILDVHMPGMDGFEVCRRLRLRKEFLFLPILFLTASRDDADWIRNADSGSNSYLNKPVEQDKLRTEIRQLLAFGGLGAVPPPVRAGR